MSNQNNNTKQTLVHYTPWAYAASDPFRELYKTVVHPQHTLAYVWLAADDVELYAHNGHTPGGILVGSTALAGAVAGMLNSAMALSGNVLSVTQANGNVVQADLTPILPTDQHLTGLSFANKTVTATLADGSTLPVNLSALTNGLLKNPALAGTTLSFAKAGGGVANVDLSSLSADGLAGVTLTNSKDLVLTKTDGSTITGALASLNERLINNNDGTMTFYDGEGNNLTFASIDTRNASFSIVGPDLVLTDTAGNTVNAGRNAIIAGLDPDLLNWSQLSAAGATAIASVIPNAALDPSQIKFADITPNEAKRVTNALAAAAVDPVKIDWSVLNPADVLQLQTALSVVAFDIESYTTDNAWAVGDAMVRSTSAGVERRAAASVYIASMIDGAAAVKNALKPWKTKYTNGASFPATPDHGDVHVKNEIWYEWRSDGNSSVWVELPRNSCAVPSAASGVPTANNGLSISGTAVQLGGTLNQATTVVVNDPETLTIRGDGTKTIKAINQRLIVDSTSARLSSNDQELSIDTSGKLHYGTIGAAGNVGQGSSSIDRIRMSYGMLSAQRSTHTCASFTKNPALIPTAPTNTIHQQFVTFMHGSTVIGKVLADAAFTGVQYLSLSDERAKMNIKSLSRGKSLSPYAITVHEYEFKHAKGSKSVGVLAQEVAKIFPDAVSGSPDEVDENGEPVMMAVDYSKLVIPAMLRIDALEKAVQELTDKVNKLSQPAVTSKPTFK